MIVPILNHRHIVSTITNSKSDWRIGPVPDHFYNFCFLNWRHTTTDNTLGFDLQQKHFEELEIYD